MAQLYYKLKMFVVYPADKSKRTMKFNFIIIGINKTLCSLHCLSQTRTQETESLKTQMSDLETRYQDGIKVNINIQYSFNLGQF